VASGARLGDSPDSTSPCRGRGHHAGETQDLLSRHEPAVSDGERQGDGGQRLEPRQGQRGHRPQDQADQRPAEEDLHERQGALDRTGGHPRGRAEQHRGEHDGHAVVEQALALHEHQQPARHAHVAEHGDDGDRVGRGDERAEQQRDDQR
jgi:hypothetical protein